MRKITLSLIIIACIITSNAQTAKTIDKVKCTCKYNYTIQQDSTDITNKKSLIMLLQLGEKTSKFCSISTHIGDSVGYLINNLSEQEQFNMFTKSISKYQTSTLCSYTIYKNYPTKNTITLTDYIDKPYKSTQQTKFNWKIITNSDTIINSFKCIKATTNFAGRNYNAWFTIQVPISDGPYKFCGLPGLIIKINDTTNQHCFTLKSLTWSSNQSIFFIEDKRTEISSKNYVKAKSAKMAELIKKVTNGDLIKFSDEDKKMEAINRVKSENNFIERY